MCVSCSELHENFKTVPRPIREYISEVEALLETIADYNGKGVTLDDKLSFIRLTRHAFGRTALVLSGGGALGAFHLVRPQACLSMSCCRLTVQVSCPAGSVKVPCKNMGMALPCIHLPDLSAGRGCLCETYITGLLVPWNVWIVIGFSPLQRTGSACSVKSERWQFEEAPN